MSGRLYAFQESRLTALAAGIMRIVDQKDAESWRRIWPRLLYIWSPLHMPLTLWGPGVLADECAAVAALSAERMPQPGSPELSSLLRFLARSLTQHSVELTEKAWHVHYPALSDEVAGFPVSESEEYEAIGRHVFSAGAMPPGLEFMDEQPYASTNWISNRSVNHLWELEALEGMLATSGKHQTKNGGPLGHDFLTIRSMLEVAMLTGWSVYLWDPGT